MQREKELDEVMSEHGMKPINWPVVAVVVALGLWFWLVRK